MVITIAYLIEGYKVRLVDKDKYDYISCDPQVAIKYFEKIRRPIHYCFYLSV